MTTRQPAASGKKRKLVNVHLLNGDQHIVYVDVKSKFQEVFNLVAGHLSLRETEYFGLAFKEENEYHFIVLDDKIHKHAPKHWKSGSGEGTDGQGQALISVWFRVQFYVDQVILLREKVTRHQYYLQLKDNVLRFNHLYSEEKCFQLAAYALQADHGNYLAERHDKGYFNPAFYFPQWMLERHGVDYLANNMPTIHRDLHNMTRNDAELRYIRNASMAPGAHNLHFYTVRKRKTDKTCNTWLAVCAKGVEVYEDDAGYKNHISTFLWRDIGKLYFDKKKFEIRSVQNAGGRRFMYYTDSDNKSKYLLTICRGTHMFQMAIQPKLMEIQHLDNEDQKRYRESYVYSDLREKQQFQPSPSKSISCGGGGSTGNQRFSVISDASSNTTSGIVSDRMAVSFDEGEDHREIMIDCPPRTAMSGTPGQSRSKFQLLSNLHSFKPSPQSNKTSPSGAPHSLELCKTENFCNASPQELSPTSSNGSWRARHSQTAACMIGVSGRPLPSPPTPTQDGISFPGLRRSLGRKESFTKPAPGSLLITSGERNTSGDSAVSVSGIFSGADKLAPLSLPQSELRGFSGSPGQSSLQQASRTLGGKNSGGSANYSLTPPLTLSHLQKTSVPSPPTSLNFHPPGTGSESSPRTLAGLTKKLEARDFGDPYKPLGSPREHGAVYKPLSSPRDIVSSPHSTFGDQYSPKDLSNQYKPLNSPHDFTKAPKPLGSPRDITNEHFKLQPSPRGLHDLKQTFGPVLDSNMETGYSLQSGPNLAMLPVLSPAQRAVVPVSDMAHPENFPSPSTGDAAAFLPAEQAGGTTVGMAFITNQEMATRFQEQQLLQLQHQQQSAGQIHSPTVAPASTLAQNTILFQHPQHQQQLQHPQHQQQLQQPHQLQLQPPHSSSSPSKGQPITEHYLLALQQQDCGLLVENTAAARNGAVLHAEQQLQQRSHQGEMVQLSDAYLVEQHHQFQQQQLQEQQQVQLQQEQQLLQNQQLLSQFYPVEATVKEQQLSSPITEVPKSEPCEQTEENKENVYHPPESLSEEEGKDQVDISSKRSHSKGVLHPELKHILGQSHAISLPLITALCNDSSLMQTSRSQSGSRSSYDTSTVRSTDSRLTRYSHETDPRRWSSCCQAAGVAETMTSVQAARPYSWHSEHFELDAQLALPVSTDSLPATNQPANPRAVNKHLNKILDHRGGSVAPKMIESDPGPSSPRMLATYPSNVPWWDLPPSLLAGDRNSTSWVGTLPYSLPSPNKSSSGMGHHSGTSQLGHSHQHMVPHKLSSGGHRDSDSSIGHKQMMKETVGIA